MILLEHDCDDRDRIAQAMAEAMERLAIDMPRMDAALMLRLAIAYFAEVHARSFGHAETIKALLAIARRGLWKANEELTAPRN
ncbi:hypothetical protein [Allosphingosinicella sp.]|uniref:hypothetical protein n=1 Tax=Allosphingosinicella sp. TaxID=2823234 RepID=UPI002FC22725